jgi:hypothetical protein
MVFVALDRENRNARGAAVLIGKSRTHNQYRRSFMFGETRLSSINSRHLTRPSIERSSASGNRRPRQGPSGHPPSRSGDPPSRLRGLLRMRLARPNAQMASQYRPSVGRRPISCPLETPARASIDRAQLFGAPIRPCQTAWPRSGSERIPRAIRISDSRNPPQPQQRSRRRGRPQSSAN